MALPHRTAWGWGMMSTAKEKDAAWLLVKKMTADEDGGGLPAGHPGAPFAHPQGQRERVSSRRRIPTGRRWSRRWSNAGSAPASFIPPDASAALGAAITRIANEEVAPRAGLSDTAPQVQAILDQYWAGKGR